jgi:uncharacterized membrane protein
MTGDTRSFERWSEGGDGAATTSNEGIPGTAATLPDPPSIGATPDAARVTAPRGVESPVGVMDPSIQEQSRARAGRSGWPADADVPAAKPDAIPSTAAIAGHPIHPMLVPVPIGLMAGALVSDLAYVATRDSFWARASLAMTAGGVVGGLVSAVAGATDFFSKREIRRHRIAWLHAGGNLAVVTLGATSAALRSRDPAKAVVPAGLLMSLTAATLLLGTGWLGGELVYRERVGVVPR